MVSLAASGAIVGFTSPALQEELGDVLARDFELPPVQSWQVSEKYGKILNPVQPTERILFAPDPDDAPVLECAVAAKADGVASWDPHLTDAKQFQGIRIMNPGEWLAEFRKIKII